MGNPSVNIQRHNAEQFDFSFKIDPTPAPFEFHHPEAGMILANVLKTGKLRWAVLRDGTIFEETGGRWAKI